MIGGDFRDLPAAYVISRDLDPPMTLDAELLTFAGHSRGRLVSAGIAADLLMQGDADPLGLEVR